MNAVPRVRDADLGVRDDCASGVADRARHECGVLCEEGAESEGREGRTKNQVKFKCTKNVATDFIDSKANCETHGSP
jgi:hypothetical protein